jgi:DNA-binding CsgD family transcriptional regulator
MPSEFAGKSITAGGYTISQPKKWSAKEIEWLKDMTARGYSYKEIAESMGRTEVSVSIKAKRLGKKQNTYNEHHVVEKYELNKKFVEYIKPKTVLDLYCGEKNYYSQFEGIRATTNDINKSIKADYNEDALKLICKLYYDGDKFDIVDLDPFGSAYDCFDLAIKMARKGIVITLGELGHKRWKRLDYVGTHYDIDNLSDFTIDRLVEEIRAIGRRNKKELRVVELREWKNIGRVWFEIKPLKVTSQWAKK